MAATKAANASYILLDVDGVQFDFFSDYTVQSDLLQPGGEFHFGAALISSSRGVRANLGPKGLAPGRKVALRLVTPKGQTLQHTGRIYDVQYEVARKTGSTILVVVRDHMHGLVHGDALPDLAIEGMTFADVVKAITRKYGFADSDVTVNSDAARSLVTGKPAAGATLSAQAPIDLEAYKVDQAMPQAGENAYAYLARHARRFGLLVWGSADGKVIIGRPNYTQKPAYRFQLIASATGGVSNNVQSFRRRLSMSQRPSEVHVYGKSHGGDWYRTQIHEIVSDDEVKAAGIYAPITVHDNAARDATQARERGRYEIGKRRQTSDVVSVSLARHAADDGTVYGVDTMADVYVPSASVDASMYVVRRTFSCAFGTGTETTLDLVPKNSIVLGEGIK